MSYFYNGLEITNQHLMNILKQVREFGAIDKQTFLSNRGVLKNGKSDEEVGRFLTNCGFIHDAFMMNDQVHTITRVPIEPVKRTMACM